MKARGLVLLLVVLAIAAPSCKARDEWKISVETNLPIPQFGDRVYLEVLDANGKIACDDCARVFGPLTPADFPLTFGIVRTTSTVRVRGRLYRSIVAGPDGLPTGASLVDVVAQLPPLEAGVDDSNVAILFVPDFCFGVPPDLDAHLSCSYQAASDELQVAPEPVLTLFQSGGLHQSDKLATARACTMAPPDGMACVGGGAFLLGDERVSIASDYPAQPVRARDLLAPIALDIDEMTVGAVRKLIAKRLVNGATGFTRRGAVGTAAAACTYDNDGSNDALPMNCVTRAFATDVCRALDRRLPTESEWEFAAVNGGAETQYPWGDPDRGALYESTQTLCARAIVGRGRAGTEESTTCGGAPGPVAGGSDGDVTRAGLRNMGGNLAEWVQGEFAFYTEKCWAKAGFEGDFDSPCDEASTILTAEKPRVPYRGASWARPPEATAGASRFAAADDVASPAIGFRCAWNEPP